MTSELGGGWVVGNIEPRKTHFVALVESFSCPGVRIWTNQTQLKTRGGRQKRG